MKLYQFITYFVVLCVTAYFVIIIALSYHMQVKHTRIAIENLKTEITTLRQELKTHDEQKEWWQAE